jgi:hypothetical protein
MFRPSSASYGQTDSDPVATLEQYAPLVQSVVESATDASRQSEVLRAQIKNTKQLMRRQPWLRNVLQLRLRKLRARLRAAERRLEKQRESESSTRTFRALGQTGIVAGIVLVGALTYYVVSRARS